jgi:hypothetical protein
MDEAGCCGMVPNSILIAAFVIESEVGNRLVEVHANMLSYPKKRLRSR